MLFLAAAVLLNCGLGAQIAEERTILSLQSQLSSVDGSVGASAERLANVRDGYIGLERFQLRPHDLGEGWKLLAEGRAGLAPDDHGALIRFQHTRGGEIWFAFDQFRVNYRKSGGFLWDTETFQGDPDAYTGVYRRKFEVGIRWPLTSSTMLSFRYQRRERAGEKNSTIWGDNVSSSFFSGLPKRGIVPTAMLLDEALDRFQLDIRHEGDTSHLEGTLIYEKVEISNSRLIRRSADYAPDARRVTQTNETSSDTWIARAAGSKVLSDRYTVSASFLYSEMDTDALGSRVYGDGFFNPYALEYRRLQDDEGYLDLDGRSDLEQKRLNASLLAQFNTHWKGVLAIQAEEIQRRSGSTSLVTDWERNPATFLFGGSEQEQTVEAEQALQELRLSGRLNYAGLKNHVVYLRGESRYTEGDLQEALGRRRVAPAAGDPRSLFRSDSDYSRKGWQVEAGDDLYLPSKLTMGVRLRAGEAENRYDSVFREVSSEYKLLYPLYLASQENSWREASIYFRSQRSRSFTPQVRIGYRELERDSQPVGAERVEAFESSRYWTSAGLSWIPHPRMTVMVQGMYVDAMGKTPASEIEGRFENLVEESSNSYFNFNSNVRFQLDARTLVGASYAYYRADNFIDVSGVTQPYGVDDREQVAGVSISRRWDSGIEASLHYQYVEFVDKASGGHLSFEAHLVSGRLLFQF